MDAIVGTAPLEVQKHDFRFSGSGREYFGIWIVNIVLTVLTIGIYSAWAKIRRERYFLGHTQLAGSSFDYHASPISILIGRIIILAILAVYNILLNIFPIVGLVFAVLFMFATPYFIQRGIRFNARMTSYRNIRFNFTGGYWGAFAVFILGGFLSILSLGLAIPLVSKWSWRYVLGNLQFGGRPFANHATAKALYRQFIVPAAIAIVAFASVISAVILQLRANPGLVASFNPGNAGGPPTIPWIIIAAYLCLFFLFLVLGAIYGAGVRNVAITATVIDGKHGLSSDMNRWTYAWIVVSNLFATVFSLGLARPWAHVRRYRYMTETMSLAIFGSLDDFTSEELAAGSAAGSAYMDIEGFDFGM